MTHVRQAKELVMKKKFGFQTQTLNQLNHKQAGILFKVTCTFITDSFPVPPHRGKVWSRSRDFLSSIPDVTKRRWSESQVFSKNDRK